MRRFFATHASVGSAKDFADPVFPLNLVTNPFDSPLPDQYMPAISGSLLPRAGYIQ